MKEVITKTREKHTWSDRDEGVLSDRGYSVKPEKELERTVQYSNGEKKTLEERRKYKNRNCYFISS